MSIGLLTPNQAHKQRKVKLKTWKHGNMETWKHGNKKPIPN